MICKATCIPVFTAALFTIAKVWKQSKCPSTDEQIKMMWHTHAHIHNRILARIKEWAFSICSNMDGLRGLSDKWNKSDRERHTLYDIISM